MFRRSKFNGDIVHWDVSNVTNMESMFEGSRFNQDISNWDVSKVRSMRGLFANALFSQDVARWKIHPRMDRYALHNNADFLRAQSMSDWVIALHLEGDTVPNDAAWAWAFQEVESLATSLYLSSSESVQAIRACYDARRGGSDAAEQLGCLNLWGELAKNGVRCTKWGSSLVGVSNGGRDADSAFD